jgi:putative DNA primase/helicase
MTGGEPITARFMRQNFFSFKPKFKLWLVANDRPRVRGTDDAFWRRVRVLPFSIKIPDRDLDQYLPDKLHAELPGILAWAVRGCLKWQAERLSLPKAVRQGTADWQRDMNHLTKFFNDLLILAPSAKIASSQPFSRYETWCSDNGEPPLKISEFNAKFQEKYDVTHTRIKGRSWWRGVKFLE